VVADRIGQVEMGDDDASCAPNVPGRSGHVILRRAQDNAGRAQDNHWFGGFVCARYSFQGDAMKYFPGGVVVLFLMLSTGVAQDDAAKKDLDALQGVWQMVSMEIEGKALPADEIKGFKLTFKGNQGSHSGRDGKIEEATIKLDPSKKPKAIDMTTQGKTLVGIYSIEGDNLKICSAKPGGNRPTEFKGGKDVVYYVLKREKP
jgi:uncharacterized protein (TIGR03067 family)